MESTRCSIFNKGVKYEGAPPPSLAFARSEPLLHATDSGALSVTLTSATAAEPEYAAKVPESVTTPDKLHTELLGDLEFFDGMPSKATVKKAYDFLDFSRGAQAFLDGMPAASIYGLLEGFKEAGVNPGDLGIFEKLMAARSLFLTPNSTTIYNVAEIDVKDGPVVVEIPPGVLVPVDDAYFRWVVDVGATGPDQGEGGKYLFVHRAYKGAIPDGYFVARTPSYRNLMFFRAFVKDGDLKATADGVKAGFRMYPLAQASKPPQQRFVNLSGKQMNTVHANNFHFYEELNAVIQYEPADSVYEFTAQDAAGEYLDGGKTYSVTLPGPVPVNNFWSFMVYSGQHRSMLETDQKLAGLDSNNPSIKPNADGSYTMWFGPKAPQGLEGNWIQTMPGKSYNVLLRLYGPLQPSFDQTWKLGDFELIDDDAPARSGVFLKGLKRTSAGSTYVT